MNYLNEAYILLKKANLIHTWDELSTQYLLKSPSYARAVRAMKRDISMSALASLAFSLQEKGQSMKNSKFGNILGDGDKICQFSDILWKAVKKRSSLRTSQKSVNS